MLTMMQENRDKHIGRVSAYKALLESSILSDPRYTSDENWEFFIDQTSKQARTNPWLREECGSMLCDYITASTQSKISQEHIIKKIIEKYSGDGLLETAEGVAIWITAQKAYPDLKLPKDVWHKRDPLHSTERTRLARILCDSKGTNAPLQNPDQKKIKTSGTWKPQPNFAWRVVLQQAFAKMSSPAKLRQFCIEVIDSRSCIQLLCLPADCKHRRTFRRESFLGAQVLGVQSHQLGDPISPV
jgi:DNA polymerase phi